MMHRNRKRAGFVRKIISALIVVTFTTSNIVQPAAVYAKENSISTQFNLPAPGMMVHTSKAFRPALIQGLVVYPDNPLKFDFIIDSGDSGLDGSALKGEAEKQIKYFLAALTVPEEQMWVNLSPYEKEKMVPESFGATEMGRDLLVQDYMLKQLSASLMYPEEQLGSEFWKRVYQKAHEKYGNINIPMNTFNKVWIVPDTAVVYEQGMSAFVVDSHLKVMLEQDYLALQKNMSNSRFQNNELSESDVRGLNAETSQVVREVLLPEIEKEVNEGKTFANLRQIYSAAILASWYKDNLRQSLLGQVYVDRNKVKGVDVEDKSVNEKIYNQYVEAFKQGVYDYIREDEDPVSHQVVARQHFSGGTHINPSSVRKDVNDSKQLTPQQLAKVEGTKSKVTVENFEVGPKGDPNLAKMFGTVLHRKREGRNSVNAAIETAIEQKATAPVEDLDLDLLIDYLQSDEAADLLEDVLKARGVDLDELIEVIEDGTLGFVLIEDVKRGSPFITMPSPDDFQAAHVGIRNFVTYFGKGLYDQLSNSGDRNLLEALLIREATAAVKSKRLWEDAVERAEGEGIYKREKAAEREYADIVAQAERLAEEVEKKLVGDRLDQYIRTVADEFIANSQNQKKAKAQSASAKGRLGNEKGFVRTGPGRGDEEGGGAALLTPGDHSVSELPELAEVLRKPESIADGIRWKEANEYIFGGGFGYDIRINDAESAVETVTKFAYALGRTFGGDRFLKREGDVLVTGDQRTTSDAIRLAVAQGLMDEGLDVTTQRDGDDITTGLPSREAVASNYRLVIQVTGSHNPKIGNGLKITYEGRPFYSKQLMELSRAISEQEGWTADLEDLKGNDFGELFPQDVISEHITGLAEVLPALKTPPSLISDFRGGAAGKVFTGIAEKKGYRVIRLNSAEDVLTNEVFATDGKPTLISLNEQPSPEMTAGIWDPSKPEAYDGIRRLQQRIYSDPRFHGKKYAGLVFDGDGDRSGMATEDGELVMPERMLNAFYQRFIIENEEAIRILNRLGHTLSLAMDVRSSAVVKLVLKRVAAERGLKIKGEFIAAGYPNHRSFVREELEKIEKLRTDHSLSDQERQLIEKLMVDYTSAEASGHFFFNVVYPKKFLAKKIVVDDGIASAFIFLHLIDTLNDFEFKGSPVPVSELTVTKVNNLFESLPVSNEIRLDGAPNEVAKKQAFAEQAILDFINQYPTLSPMPYDELAAKVAAARTNPPARQDWDDPLLLVDGVRLQLTNGTWVMLRKSNTSAVIVFKAEAASSQKGPELIKTMRQLEETMAELKAANPDFANIQFGAYEKDIQRLANAVEREESKIVSVKMHQVLDPNSPSAKDFRKGGFGQPGYGITAGAAIDGNFAVGAEGNQGYFVDRTNVSDGKGGFKSGKQVFLDGVEERQRFYARRKLRNGQPIALSAKIGIGGQHTPSKAIEDIFTAADPESAAFAGEYELGQNYRTYVPRQASQRGIAAQQIALITSSKSGLTDETMLIFMDLLYGFLQDVADSEGLKGPAFAKAFFNYLHGINFNADGTEVPQAQLFKGFNFDELVANIRKSNPGITSKQVKKILGTVLGNMFFETTDVPEESRLSAFIRNSGLDKILGEDAPGFGAMWENVGGRWTVDLHMMTFLAFYGLDAAHYWQSRYEGIQQIRAGQHPGNQLGNVIVDNDVKEIVLLLPDPLFWFGKTIEQNFNESIWQNGAPDLRAIKKSWWQAQAANYARRPGVLVVNLTGENLGPDFNVFDVEPLALQKDKQKLAEDIGRLFTTFYGMTHTVGTRLMARALIEKGYTAGNINVSDLRNPATRIFREHLIVLQPFVELGKTLLADAYQAQTKDQRSQAQWTALSSPYTSKPYGETNVPQLQRALEYIPTSSRSESFARVISEALAYAQSQNRQLVPFIYLDGQPFVEMQDDLYRLGVPWVLQGTGDQHINVQHVLAHPDRYLVLFISFLPGLPEKSEKLPPDVVAFPKKKPVPFNTAIGFTKGYLDGVIPVMVRDSFAEFSYKALTEKRAEQGGQGIFIRLRDDWFNGPAKGFYGRSLPIIKEAFAQAWPKPQTELAQQKTESQQPKSLGAAAADEMKWPADDADETPIVKSGQTLDGSTVILGTGNNITPFKDGQVYSAGNVLRELGHNILGTLLTSPDDNHWRYEWKFTGFETKGDKPVKKPGEKSFEDVFKGISLARAFTVREGAVDIVRPYLGEWADLKRFNKEGDLDSQAITAFIQNAPELTKKQSELIERANPPQKSAEDFYIELSRFQVEVLFALLNKDEKVLTDKQKELQGKFRDALLIAITQAVTDGNATAEDFVSHVGSEMGRAFAHLFKHFPGDTWIERTVLISGIGENFARIKGKEGSDDILVGAIRTGLAEELQEIAGIEKMENVLTPDRIGKIANGVVRSDLTWERELVAARLTPEEVRSAVEQGLKAEELVSVGVSLGGTKIGAGLINASGQVAVSSEIKWQTKYPYTSEGAVQGILEQITEVLKSVKDLRNVRKIVISFAGPVDSATGIVGTPFKAVNTPFDHYPLVQAVTQGYQQWARQASGIDVSGGIMVVYNDGDAAVLGEARSPQGKLFVADSTRGENESDGGALAGLKQGPIGPASTGGDISPTVTPPGGIDLNPALLDLQIIRDGHGVPLPINQQPILNMQIEGLVPVIINITPVNLPLLLGIADERQEKKTSDKQVTGKDRISFAVREEEAALN